MISKGQDLSFGMLDPGNADPVKWVAGTFPLKGPPRLYLSANGRRGRRAVASALQPRAVIGKSQDK